ncbi:MAG: response regulator [Desulfobacteraceae bacterium]|jgi:signal transduction histidine kinase/ActR/RegA family two-component response regulator
MIKRFHKLSIRNKLSFIVLITSGLLIGLMATYFIMDKYFSYRKNMVENISTLAKVIGINSTAALAFDDPTTAAEILSALSAEPDVRTACIYNIDGAVFGIYENTITIEKKNTGGFPLGSNDTKFFIERFSQRPNDLIAEYRNLYISYPIILNARTIGHVAIRADMTRFNTRLKWFILTTGGASIFLFWIAHFICTRLHRVIIDPLADMLNTMQLVSTNGDYSRRVTCRTEDELGVLIESFNDMLSQIQDRDQELEAHRDRLEELISVRTYELQQSNDQLKKEIHERIQMQEELARAQKMEAIGMLAAGVAHDLNNILSGITSYPEYLLITLPEDSPLRKPLLTIQNSGNKAAAIVEDLLVLSRRSVAMVDVVYMDKLMDDYLVSPEFEKLLSCHPRVDIETNYDSELMPVAGSQIHLQKMVMNLITNAVEALPDGGTITVEACNVYVDRPIKGYETVEEGDYVCLRIADTGTGIESEILSRIFEPFFTKKKLGRSGTGLGMAIVWGSIKDHKGYIEVESTLGKGTTFKIYLPVSRKVIKVAEPTDQKDYKGHGESILVVDDSPDQREIASIILTKLGYNVKTVSSGEAAVEYLSTNKFDLILLDMIMEPGMNGLETYRCIIKIYPGQRAVIASGYSESEQVRQTQALGAGKYIRKPYSIEKIAAAVRTELDSRKELSNN